MINIIGKKNTRRIVPENMKEYVEFCKNLNEGDILCEVGATNISSELLLVAAKIAIVIGDTETYSLLLLGIKKVGDRIIPDGKRVDVTPQKVSLARFLKLVGHCEYNLIPDIEKYKVNSGLVVYYKDTNLKAFSKEHSRKPRMGRYGDDGELLVKSTNNKRV